MRLSGVRFSEAPRLTRVSGSGDACRPSGPTPDLLRRIVVIIPSSENRWQLGRSAGALSRAEPTRAALSASCPPQRYSGGSRRPHRGTFRVTPLPSGCTSPSLAAPWGLTERMERVAQRTVPLPEDDVAADDAKATITLHAGDVDLTEGESAHLPGVPGRFSGAARRGDRPLGTGQQPRLPERADGNGVR